MSTDDNQSDGQVCLQFGRGSAGNYRYWGSNGGLTVDTWHHVAAVFKASDKTLVLYVDGIEVDSGTGTFMELLVQETNRPVIVHFIPCCKK